jgi:hypothetical protein
MGPAPHFSRWSDRWPRPGVAGHRPRAVGLKWIRFTGNFLRRVVLFVLTSILNNCGPSVPPMTARCHGVPVGGRGVLDLERLFLGTGTTRQQSFGL